MLKYFASFRSSPTVKNSFWNVAEVSLYPLAMLAFTPFFISRLGVEVYGLWMLVNSITGGLGILSLGVGDANIRYMALHLGSGKKKEALAVVNASLSLGFIFSVVTVVAGLLAAWLLFKHNFFDLSGEMSRMALQSIPFAILLLGSKNMEQVLLSSFKGSGRYDISGKLGLVSKTGMLAANVVMVLLGYSLPYLFAASFVVSLAMQVVISMSLKRQEEGINILPRFDKKDMKEIASYGIWAWFQSVFTVVASQADKYLVAAYAGLEVLSYYSIGYLIFSQLHNFFASAGAWIFQRVSALRQNAAELSKLFVKSLRIYVTLSLLLLLAMYFSADFLFTFWLGEDFYTESKIFIQAFIGYEALLLMSIVPFYFLNGSGEIKTNTFLEIGVRILNLAAILVFFFLFGAEGIAYGLILSAAIYLPVQYYITAKLLFGISRKACFFLLPAFMGTAAFLAGQGIYGFLGILAAFVLLYFLLKLSFKDFGGFGVKSSAV